MLQAHKQIEVCETEPRRQQRVRSQLKTLHLSASDAWDNYLAQEIKEDVSRCRFPRLTCAEALAILNRQINLMLAQRQSAYLRIADPIKNPHQAEELLLK